MATLIVLKKFADQRNEVQSPRIRHNIDRMVKTIEQMPGVGSSLLPRSVRARCDNRVLKAVVSPYEIIYEYDRDADTVFIYELLPCSLAI